MWGDEPEYHAASHGLSGASDVRLVSSPPTFTAGVPSPDAKVGGFQVTVHDSAAMRAIERLRYLHPVAQQLLHRQRSRVKACCERLSFQILHHQKVDALLLADVVE